MPNTSHNPAKRAVILVLVAALVVVAGLGIALLNEHMRRGEDAVVITGLTARLQADEDRIHELQTRLRATPPPELSALNTIPAAPSAARRQRAHPAASVALASGLTPVGKLENRGLKSARAAFTTQVWASSVGNIDAAAAGLTFTPEGRHLLDNALKSLPADITAQYDTPEKLMAYILAGSPHPLGGIAITNETSGDNGTAEVTMNWQHQDDDIVHTSTLTFRQAANGDWQQVVPVSVIRRGVAYLLHQ